MDNLWDATRGSTPSKSTVDQAKRSVLPTRIGVMMARSSEFNPVLRLIQGGGFFNRFETNISAHSGV